MSMAMAVTSTHAFNYHVFLSFRGPDTRYGFTGNLYKALCDKGIHTFIDDEELQKGEEITPSLVAAIQVSKVAIVVLSKHYASSSFCLDELLNITHCMSKGLMVIPVFYMVDPSDVRHQRGSYEEALTNHERRFLENKLQEWKEALRKVANLSGYHFKDGDAYEYKFIGSIVASVSEKINHPVRLHVGDCLVGLELRVAKVMELLDVGSENGVHVVGIHGMGGIGKSTLVRAVYNNLISQNFNEFCFLENTREESNKHGLQHLQNILLSKVLGEKAVNLSSWREGASIIQDRLRGKKVLLVLDDVDNDDQLQAFLVTPCWLCPGSRVIITTRDVQLLKRHKVEKRYEVNELNEKDALQLLTWKAFQNEEADPTYGEVLNRVVTYASGLPLALEVIGSNLFGKSIDHWESAINQYNRIPHTRIQDILQVSFDTLEGGEKSVFLDIACGIKGYELKEAEVMLSALYGYNVKYHIGVLADKSLIKVGDGIIKMHDLVRDMGRHIDQEKSHKEPEKRKRLWLWKDIIEVLKHNKGTSEIEIIYLDVPISDREKIIEWDGNGFKEMKNLKILIIKNGKFSEGPKCLPNSLRVLEWWGYPSNCLPSDFQPHQLSICKLPHGCFTSFELDRSSKMFQNLTVLNFDECKSLTKIPDLSSFLNLEKLSFRWCANLVTVHESIGCLNKIKEISAYSCKKLMSFPSIHSTSLENLSLSHTGLERFPEISRKMENIESLDLQATPIKELPISFGNLVGLESFSLYGGGTVVKLPIRVLMMPKLMKITVKNWKGVKWVKEEEIEGTARFSSLNLENCNLDDDFFSTGFTQFARVEYLDLSENNFTFLPECIKEFRSLRSLSVSHCDYLLEIRGLPPKIEYFYAINCKSLRSSSISRLINEESLKAVIFECVLPRAWIPEWFDHQSKGPSTSLWFRNCFPDKFLCLLIAPTEFTEAVVFLNGKKVEVHYTIMRTQNTGTDHTYIFKLGLSGCWPECELNSGWNHVEVTYAGSLGLLETSIIKATGIHVLGFDWEFSEEGEKVIRFSNPFESDTKRFLKRPRIRSLTTKLYSFMSMQLFLVMGFILCLCLALASRFL